ncbi:endonuclease/exonuclease/phosphatase family protein [Brevirhabdus sp.]|uniref:endonuclease/exonuclease/phosphatase family protein n=1 Tax=Brevirhabdus sp. TaxID=2004514 RepID=UPI004057F86A
MRGAALWLTGGLIVLLSVASLLPFIETNIWFIRYLDFPRMQFALALIVLLAVFAALGALMRGWGLAVAAMAALALVYHGYRLWPYQPMASPMIERTADCPADRQLRVMVANVRRGNEKPQLLLDLAGAERPDLLIVMETNERWDRALRPLDAQFAEHVQSIPDDATYFGMHLFSRLPLRDSQVRFPFGADTPLIVAEAAHPAAPVRLFAIHPRPPQMLQPSTMRDATLLEAALEAADSPTPAILAGDFNGTPWERTTRRAMRLGGLVDPRVGRAPMSSFDAESRWMKWPLDQILWQRGLGLVDFTVLPDIGSDHYPVRADLCVGEMADARVVPAAPDDRQEARTAIEAARALPDAPDKRTQN